MLHATSLDGWQYLGSVRSEPIPVQGGMYLKMAGHLFWTGVSFSVSSLLCRACARLLL